MSTFFRQTAQAMIAKHIDRFPLLKLDQVIDWQPIEQYLNRQRTRYLRDHRGRPAYPLLSMFNAHECKHLSPLLEGLPEGTTVYADKGYDSEENRQHLEQHRLQDGIMRKAHRNRPLTEA